MEQLMDEEEKFQINIKRSVPGKFFKELNYQTSEKMKKEKRRFRKKTQMSEKKIEKHQEYGLNYDPKPSKKASETIKNGNRVIANYKNNQLNGEVEIYYQNGTVFKGVYQNGIKVKGHFTFPNGYEYIGHCLGNKFNGEGCLIFPSGKMMSGEWKDYEIVGNAKMEYPKGEVYYGEIKDYKKHGQGHLFFNDNSKYVGEFKYGLITGKGQYFQNDQLIEEGEWLDGELVEEGRPCPVQSDQKNQGISIDDVMIEKIEMEDHEFTEKMNLQEEPDLQPRIKINKNPKKVRFGP